MRPKKPAVTLLDGVILTAVLGFFGFFCYRLFFELNYKWNWPVIPTYLVRFDPEQQRWVANVLLEGFFTTIRLSVWAMLFAVLLGFLVGILRISPRLFCRLTGRTYVEAIRNTPPLVLVFIFYYFISDQLFAWLAVEDLFRASPQGVQELLTLLFAGPALITRFLSGVLTLALFQGAYIAEIVRAGIEAIDTGQWEAGRTLGLTRWQLMRLIILPQAVKIMLPPLAGEFINTVKWSSIVSIISIEELTFQGLQVMASTQATIEVWLTVSGLYLVLCLSLSLVVRRIERRLARPDSPYPQMRP
ncbi:MAG: amino acid ABC transporter permease [Desulfobacterales bacterium GWB2_56_26]|nr:MAG: amino acid ABC transporter permease [Desulfobacterales bacterium GWB2_56_26]